MDRHRQNAGDPGRNHPGVSICICIWDHRWRSGTGPSSEFLIWIIPPPPRSLRAFLEQAQEEGALIDVSDELPKAFVLTEEYGMRRVYLTQLGAATLQRRLEAARDGNL